MIDILSPDIIAQAIGVFASGFMIFSYYQKQDLYLKICLMTANLLFAVHFFLMDANAGMAINLLNLLRVGTSIKFHKSTKLMLVFMSTSVVIGFFVFETYYDLLPIFCSLLGSFSMFKLSGVSMRYARLIGSFGWLTYGIKFQSIGQILTELTSIILNLTTIYRLKRDKKNPPTA
jgi:hypothetical protein